MFDHHCKYLNNCIGGKNYHSFFRMLVMVTAFCIVIIGSALWIFVFAQNDGSFNSRILSKWGVLATLIYTIVMMISVDTLLCFHLYLVLKLKKTTLEFLDIKTHDYVDSSKDVIEG
jgi:nitrogen fixation/metabolism regulation signal transduction histidine kinase